MYFDTHCHLNSEQLYENRDEFIKHALDNQVEMMVVVGYDLESSKKAVEIAKEHSFIYAAVGIGPNDCLNTTTQDLQIIDEYLNEPKVVALGEIGLDYYWDDVPSDRQKEIFQQQVDLAKKHQKPIIIHCRDAYEDTYEVLKRNGHPGIMHCYSGSVEMAKRFIDLGFYISCSGIITFKNAESIREAIRYVPADRLLVETDSPYLAPVPYRGKENQPAYTREVCEYVAALKGLSMEEFAQISTQNFERLFKINVQ